jgi:polysaccharide export outer membrane protein
MKRNSLAALLVTLGLAGTLLAAQQAAPAAKQEAPGETAKPATTAEPVKAASLPSTGVDNNTYILGGDDVVAVHVWREPDLTSTLTVRPDGKITMPLIKEIQAGGLTPNQLAEAITTALGKFVNHPDVGVEVVAVRSRRYFVDGEINHPGAFPLATPTTVFEAIAMAGGFREFANKKNILILRGDKRLKFNWVEVVKGKNLSQNINLENGDHIMVQ